MANTLQEIREEVYNMLGEPTDSTDEFWSTRIDADINRFQNLVIKWGIKSEIDGTTYNAPDLRFMRKKSYITRHWLKSLTVAVTASDTEVNFNTTDFESAGYGMVEQDVFQYTWKTETQVTWVTSLDTTHAIGKRVAQVYLIPTTAFKVFWVEFLWVNIPSDDTWVNELDFRASRDFNKFYTVLWSNDSTSNQFIHLNWYSNNDRFIIHYYDKSTDMASDSETTNLPEEYGRFVLAPLVAWSVLYYTDEAELGRGYLAKWYANLNTMYNQFAEQTKQYRPHIKSPNILRDQNKFRRYRRY